MHTKEDSPVSLSDAMRDLMSAADGEDDLIGAGISTSGVGSGADDDDDSISISATSAANRIDLGERSVRWL